MGLFIFRKKSKVSIADPYFLKLTYDEETLTTLKEAILTLEDNTVKESISDLPYLSFSQFSLLFNQIRDKQLQLEKIEVIDNSKGKLSTKDQLFAINVMIDEYYLNVLQPLTESLWNNSAYANLTYNQKRDKAEELGSIYLKATGDSKLSLPYIPEQSELEDEDFYEAEFSYDYNPNPENVIREEGLNQNQRIEFLPEMEAKENIERPQLIPIETSRYGLEDSEEDEVDDDNPYTEFSTLEDEFPDNGILFGDSIAEVNSKKEEDEPERVSSVESPLETLAEVNIKPLWMDQLSESEEFNENEFEEDDNLSDRVQVEEPLENTKLEVQESDGLSESHVLMAKATEVALQIIDEYEAKQKAKIFKDLSEMDNRALIKEQVLEKMKQDSKDEKKLVLTELSEEKEKLLEEEEKRHKETLLQIQQDFESKMAQLETVVVERLKGPAQEEINRRFKEESSRLSEILKSKINKLESIKISLRENVLEQLETAVAEISDDAILKPYVQPDKEPALKIDSSFLKDEPNFANKKQYQRLESTADFEDIARNHLHSSIPVLSHR